MMILWWILGDDNQRNRAPFWGATFLSMDGPSPANFQPAPSRGSQLPELSIDHFEPLAFKKPMLRRQEVQVTRTAVKPVHRAILTGLGGPVLLQKPRLWRDAGQQNKVPLYDTVKAPVDPMESAIVQVAKVRC